MSLNPYQFFLGLFTSLWALVLPIQDFILFSTVMIVVNFFVSNYAEYDRAESAGVVYKFSKKLIRKAVLKLVFIEIGMVAFWVMDTKILHFTSDLHLAEYFCAFLCGYELWNFLRDAGHLSGYTVFMELHDFLRNIFKTKAGIDFDKFNRKKRSSRRNDNDNDNEKTDTNEIEQ